MNARTIMSEEKTVTGRKPLDIDPDLVFKLAQRGLNAKVIGQCLGASQAVILERFRAELIKGRAMLIQHLLGLQLKSAERGNITMQIWLGKQYCGQTDKVAIKEDDGKQDEEDFSKMSDEELFKLAKIVSSNVLAVQPKQEGTEDGRDSRNPGSNEGNQGSSNRGSDHSDSSDEDFG